MIPKTMKAARLHAPGDLRIEEVPVPELGHEDVLVRVNACGLCGSDVPRILTQGTYSFPTIPGHEFGGTVAAVGRKVRSACVDDRVAVIPLIPCRKCRLCEIGEFALCEAYNFLGSRSDGGFAEYVRVPAGNLVTLPEEMDEESAAFLEPVATTLNAICSLGVGWGMNVMVTGLGPIGNLTAQWAKAHGARHVFAFDLVPERVELARRLGLLEAFEAGSVDIEDIVMEKTQGEGIDVALEASGSGTALQHAVMLLRHSGRLGLLGRPGNDMLIAEKTYERIMRRQLTVKGCWSFQFRNFPHHAWRQSAEAIADKRIAVAPLVSHRLPLDKLEEGIHLMASRTEGTLKILIKL